MTTALPGALCNRHGEHLDFTFTPGSPDQRHIVVIGHGVTSHKDRPWLIALGEALASAGVPSLRFSFAGNGASEGRYQDATISKEIDDLGCVLDALAAFRVAYAGHSMGGAVGLLRAARDPRLQALVSLAGMIHVGNFMKRMFGHLTPDRDVMLGKPHCPLTRHFLGDAGRYDSLLTRAAEVAVPWLIVHGTADDIVPLQDSRDAVAAAGGRPRLIEMAGVDHRYTGHEHEMAAQVTAWLVRWTRASS